MKGKKEYGILAAIIAALVLYLILRSPDRSHYRLPRVPDLAGAEVSKIEISTIDTSIILSKKDDRWYIAPQGYPANENKAKDMLSTIGTLTLTALVSESRNYDRYDLGEDKKITVRAYEGNTLRREFDVGKTAPSYQHTFVKLAGDDRIFHAQGNFRTKFDQAVENLWDRAVLSFERTEIQEIQITKGNESILVAQKQVPVEVSVSEKANAEGKPPPKSEKVWESADGKKGDESKLNRLLTALSNLRCEEYLENRGKDDFTNPIYTITLKGVQEYSLSLFAKTDKDAKDYPAISSQRDFPFLLADRQADNIMKNPNEMLEKAEKP